MVNENAALLEILLLQHKKVLSVLRFYPAVLAAAVWLLACAASGWADGVEPAIGEVRAQVTRILDREGYIGSFRNGQELQRGISAYLWDHRYWLQKTDFHNSRQLDALLCLLIKQGQPGFESYAENRTFMGSCQQLVK